MDVNTVDSYVFHRQEPSEEASGVQRGDSYGSNAA